MSPIIMLVLFNLPPKKSPNCSTNLKPVYGLPLEYGSLFTMRIFTVFVPIFIFHCKNSKVTCLPLLINNGLYPSLYIMPVPQPFLSSLGMFLKQYPVFLNLFMLSQSTSFTHDSVRKLEFPNCLCSISTRHLELLLWRAGPTAQHMQDSPILFIQLKYVHK